MVRVTWHASCHVYEVSCFIDAYNCCWCSWKKERTSLMCSTPVQDLRLQLLEIQTCGIWSGERFCNWRGRATSDAMFLLPDLQSQWFSLQSQMGASKQSLSKTFILIKVSTVFMSLFSCDWETLFLTFPYAYFWTTVDLINWFTVL